MCGWYGYEKEFLRVSVDAEWDRKLMTFFKLILSYSLTLCKILNNYFNVYIFNLLIVSRRNGASKIVWNFFSYKSLHLKLKFSLGDWDEMYIRLGSFWFGKSHGIVVDKKWLLIGMVRGLGKVGRGGEHYVFCLICGWGWIGLRCGVEKVIIRERKRK